MILLFQLVLYFSFVGFLKATVHCPSDGKWVMKSFDNSFFCYTTLDINPNVNTVKEVLKNDICKQNAHPSSRIASIHSQAENDFLMNKFYGSMIGFFIPNKIKWNPNKFRWSDGSQIDFVGWDIHGIPKQPDNQFPKEGFVKLRQKYKSKGWHDYRFKEMKKVLCKMSAFEGPAPTTKTVVEETTTISASTTAAATTLTVTEIPTITSPSATATTTTSTFKTTTNTELEETTLTTLSEMPVTVSSTSPTIPTTTFSSTTTFLPTESSTIQSTTTTPTTTSSTSTTTSTTPTSTTTSTTPTTSSITTSTLPSTTTTTSQATTTTTTTPDNGGIVILDGAQP